jgi:hypothetical protein
MWIRQPNRASSSKLARAALPVESDQKQASEFDELFVASHQAFLNVHLSSSAGRCVQYPTTCVEDR